MVEKKAKPREALLRGKSLKIPTAEELLEAAVHFGHLKRRWHPKMKPFIYSERGGVHVFDLYKTREQLERAALFLKEVTTKSGSILFVGTKRQAKEIVGGEAQRVGAYFLTERWIGGLLTNFDSVKKNIEKMEELSSKMKGGEFKHYTKKEKLLIERKIAKLERDIGGLRGLKELPAALVLASARNEAIAAHEAKQMEIPVVALADTNADPGLVDYVIPSNDDAAASIAIIIKTLADAAAAGKSGASSQ